MLYSSRKLDLNVWTERRATHNYGRYREQLNHEYDSVKFLSHVSTSQAGVIYDQSTTS